MTAGLVQDIEHQVLPNITPMITFLLTWIAMIVSSDRIETKLFKYMVH